LTLSDVADSIQTHFGFRAGTITTPPETMGPVPETMPPGLAFHLGSVRPTEGAEVQIRFLHFEPQRIVIDVAGPSSVLDDVYGQLLGIVKDLRAPDGSPVIGEPVQVVNYSEISARLDFRMSDLMDRSVLEIAQRAFSGLKDGDEVFPVTLGVHVGDPSTKVIGQPLAGYAALQVRAGTRMEERIYFSPANVTTDDNVAWLEALDQRLGGANQRD